MSLPVLNIPRTDLENLTEQQQEQLEDRVAKYGQLAYCDLAIDPNKKIVQVIVDHPLPDDDIMVLQTTNEKVIDVILKACAKSVDQLAQPISFFDGK